MYQMALMSLASRFTNDALIEIGIDEAGRGSFWGPIVAGAVIIPPESEWTDVQQALFIQFRDSKKISPKKRAKLSIEIKEQIPLFGVGVVGADEINKMGIQWANREAFRRAFHAIPRVDHSNCRLLIDGVLSLDKWAGQQELIVEGDDQYMAIAAASIVAKVTHDEWIKEYCRLHPECEERYSLCSSNGYGTAKHREGIRLYGGHELHRELYIQNWLPGTTRKEKPTKKGAKSETCLIRF